MKFLTYKVSDDDYRTFTELNSIEDLIQFYTINGDIIFGTVYDYEDNTYKLGITIYDGYIE